VLQLQGHTAWIGHSITLHSTPRSPDPTLHTQEVWSSSLRAPTIYFQLLTEIFVRDELLAVNIVSASKCVPIGIC